MSIWSSQKIWERLAAFPATKKKLLLLGAYGNGNLGDKEMARVIADDLEREHEVVCFAYSPIASYDYEFPADKKLDDSFSPLEPRNLKLFDGLIIAGGGFLAWPHDPVWNPAWALAVPVPYMIFAVGAGKPLDARLVNLVSLASITSGRDASSVSGLAMVNPAVELCPDPILSLVAPPPRSRKAGTSRLFVLRGDPTPWHEKVRASLRDEDRVLFFEPHTDASLRGLFPRAEPVTTIDGFLSMLADAKLVVSERYHGAILALAGGCPTYGVYRGDHNTSKLVNFFARLGMGQFCGADLAIPDVTDGYPLEQAAERINITRAEYQASRSSMMRRFLQLLPDRKR